MKRLARAWEFLLAPVVDRYKGISITRLLAIFYAAMCWRAVELKASIGLNVLWLALATLAAAFGKSTFTFLLERLQYAGQRSETETHVTTETRVIQERRDVGEGIEATP